MRRIIMLWLRIESVFTFLYRKDMKQIDDCWRTFTDSRLKVNYCLNLFYLLFTWKHTLMYSDFVQGVPQLVGLFITWVCRYSFPTPLWIKSISNQLSILKLLTRQRWQWLLRKCLHKLNNEMKWKVKFIFEAK